jgi:CRP/FNR family transcriptional regulator
MHRSKLECLLPFWNDLDTFEKEQLLKGCFETTYRKGLMLHRSEQQCSGIMVILNGQLRTYIVSDEGREVTLFRVYQDNVCVFSATCLMDAIVFDVMIDAVEDTNVIIIPSAVLSPLIKKYPKIEAYLYKTATERFSDVIWTMQQILFLSADKRVAIFLWDEITWTNCMTISVTHDEIARYIGSAREVVTKVLKYFVQEGIVTLERGKIQVTDKKLLKKYL